MTKHNDCAAPDFSRNVRTALTRKGIRLVGIGAIPGAGAMPWANADRGYYLDDNGTGRFVSYLDVIALAEVK